MQEKNFAARFVSIPLGHKLIAMVAAVGIAVGGHLLLQRRAVLNASAAELSFDLHSAIAIDPGLASAHDPAVALAESVLTDAKVKQLAASAPTDASSITGRLGEFRSNLKLSQASSNMLEVRYFASGNELSYEAANTVAQAIAQSGFSRNGAPVDATPAPAPAAAAPAPKAHKAAAPAPGKPARAAQPNPNNSALAASLGEVETMLSSTRRNLDSLGGASGGGSRGRHGGGSSRRESDQQHLIKTGATAAERRMNQIRTSPAAKGLSGGAAGQLAEMQHAITAILSGGGASGYRRVGVSAAQIRRERAQLDEAIATVQRDRTALQKEASAPSEAADNAAPAPASDDSTPAGDDSASSGGSTITTTDLTASGQPVPGSGQTAPAQNSAAQNVDQAASPNGSDDMLTNPFTLVRSATTATPFPWWITLAAGFGFGLIYWLFAALPSQESGYAIYDTSEPAYSSGNMITPSYSYEPREERGGSLRVTPEPAAVERSHARHEEDRRPRRAAFQFMEADPETGARGAEQPPASHEALSFVPEGSHADPEATARELDAEPAMPGQGILLVAHDHAPAEEVPAAAGAGEPSPASEPEPAPLPEAHFFMPRAVRRINSRPEGDGAAEPSSGESPRPDRLAG